MFTAQEIEKIVSAVLDLPVQHRDAYLREACDGDNELLESVKSRITESETLDTCSQEDDPNAMLGQSIGPYEIISLLGVGGMGVIYLAHDTRQQRQVAIKCLPPHFTSTNNYRKRFLNEARAVSSLEHPNICSLYDIGETSDQRLYIAMPYYEGETLENRLRQGPLPLADAINIILQMAAGLHAAHAKGIIHRDIKPANVMLTADNFVKLLDFGVAKINGVNLTSTGVSLGTAAYMSPEQLCGEKVSVSADIWALGSILYEMLVGQRPFKGEQATAILYAILYSDYPDLTLPDSFPTELNQIIAKTLARDADDRYRSVQELIDALSAISDNEDYSEPSVGQNKHAHIPLQSVIQSKQIDCLCTTLTYFIGPIATTLVTRYARQAASTKILMDMLSEHIENDNEKLEFRTQSKSCIE